MDVSDSHLASFGFGEFISDAAHKKGGSGRLISPGPLHMIEVTRLNGTSFTLNALYIERIESSHDTTITLTTGTKYIVRDSEKELREKIAQFYQKVQLLSNPHVWGEEDEE